MNEKRIDVRIPLRRRTKNHLSSMYFGVLAVGADVAGGYLAMKKAHDRGLKISFAFKQVEGRFLKRPEADVIFSCEEGEKIDAVIDRCIASGERINEPVRIVATCPSLNGDDVMAEFDLVLSMKVV